MKKAKKVTSVQISPYRREDPAKILKKLNLDTNPEWTIHYFFKPHIGGAMYNLSKKENKNG
jgi:hypothetical protein